MKIRTEKATGHAILYTCIRYPCKKKTSRMILYPNHKTLLVPCCSEECHKKLIAQIEFCYKDL